MAIKVNNLILGLIDQIDGQIKDAFATVEAMSELSKEDMVSIAKRSTLLEIVEKLRLCFAYQMGRKRIDIKSANPMFDALLQAVKLGNGFIAIPHPPKRDLVEEISAKSVGELIDALSRYPDIQISRYPDIQMK